MDSPRFPEVLQRFGIAGRAPPDREDRAEIVQLISELYEEKDRGAASRIADLVMRNIAPGPHAPTACLACTELPLAFRDLERETDLLVDGIRYVNTTMVHAKAVFRALLQP